MKRPGAPKPAVRTPNLRLSPLEILQSWGAVVAARASDAARHRLRPATEGVGHVERRGRVRHADAAAGLRARAVEVVLRGVGPRDPGPRGAGRLTARSALLQM